MVNVIPHSYVLQSIVLLSLFSVGCAIECFQCNSVEHPGCSDLKVNDTNSQYYRKCDGFYQGHEPFCRKIATEILDVSNSLRIYRSCGWIRNVTTTLNVCKKGDTDFIKKMHCACSTDACNVADSLTPSLSAVLVLTIVSCLFQRVVII